MTAISPTRAAVSVDELKRAWRAVEGGEFRKGASQQQTFSTPNTQPPAAPTVTAEGEIGCPTWQPAPAETVVPVLPCTDSLTAAVVALAIATGSGSPARIIEGGSAISSDLAGASTAELGQHGPWTRGQRDTVIIDRIHDVLTSAAELPAPAATEQILQLTVLATGWEFGQALTTVGWLGESVRHADNVVLATTATVPGLRRLETALALIGDQPATAAVLGPKRRKWAKAVEHSQGPLTRSLDRAGHLFDLPTNPDLAVNGPCSQPLPTALTGAAAALLEHVINRNNHLERELS